MDIPEHTTFELDAGIDCLAFANTLDGRLDERSGEKLTDYNALIAFAVQTGQLDTLDAQRLWDLARSQPDAAHAVLEHAIAVREMIFRIFSDVTAGRVLDESALDALNAELVDAMAHSRLVPKPDGVIWDWQSEPLQLERVLWPIVRSAAELLSSGETGRIRECAAHDCGWLFLDESRNRSRRWCSMQTCGNRAKVDRFRARKRGAQLIEANIEV